MSVTPELVKTKLSSLDSSQQSIVTISGWLMFHRRAAKQVVDVWLQAVQDGSHSKKLNLIYLANDVAQQSRAKKRTEYPEAFAKVMPTAIEHVYRHVDENVRGKITRVVDVWRERSIFPEAVLTEISTRLASEPKRTAEPASTPSGNTPAELSQLVSTYNNLLRSTSTSSLSLGTTDSLYSDLMETEMDPAAPDVYKNKITQLSSSIERARRDVEACLSARQELSRQLQALQDLCTTAVERETTVLTDLAAKADACRRADEEADRAMLAALSGSSTNGGHGRSTTPEMEPPSVEALTPPGDAGDSGDGNAQMDDGDPVARLQAELHPSITELLARQDGHGDVAEEEAYVP